MFSYYKDLFKIFDQTCIIIIEHILWANVSAKYVFAYTDNFFLYDNDNTVQRNKHRLCKF